MATSKVILDPTQYVKINQAYGQKHLQAFRDDVKFAFSNVQPALGNTAFHTIGGDDSPVDVRCHDADLWVLPTSEHSSLIISEQLHGSNDYYADIAQGKVPGHSLLHKFGHGTVGSTVIPITTSGTYQTPTTAQALEVVSDSVQDAPGGTGAHNITVIGLDSNWDEVVQDVELNGTTPVPLSTPLLRQYRSYVTVSGSYANQGVGSAVGNITVRDQTTGLVIWSALPNTPWPLSQSEIAVTTIPRGYTAYLLSEHVFVDARRAANVFVFQRPLADDVVAPYTGAMRLVQRMIGVTGPVNINYKTPRGRFVGPCDFGFMGSIDSQTADISAEFEMLLIQDGF